MKHELFAIACTVLFTGVATGQVWNEIGDAPDGPFTRQDTVGVGALTSITGVIDRAGGDHVDTYSIIITDVQAFYATTKIGLGGSVTLGTGGNADSRLWLWSEAGAPLLGNDDVNEMAVIPGSDTLASFISDPSTFVGFTGDVVNATASGIALQTGQKYLLSISEFTNDPDDAGGVDVINLGSDFDALHGPNPSAGAFVAWENGADTSVITYDIALQGAEFCTVPAPATLLLLGLAGLAGVGRRRC